MRSANLILGILQYNSLFPKSDFHGISPIFSGFLRTMLLLLLNFSLRQLIVFEFLPGTSCQKNASKHGGQAHLPAPHLGYSSSSSSSFTLLRVNLAWWRHFDISSLLLFSGLHPSGSFMKPLRPSAMCIFSAVHKSHDFAPAV